MKIRSCTIGLLTMVLSMASAQVASHAPTMKGATGTKSPSAASMAQITGKVVARVNRTELTDRDLVREMFIMFPYAQQHNGFPKDLEPEIRRGAMQMIIFEELLYQEALRRKVTIPPARIDKAVVAFRKQFATQAEYEDFLRFEGITSKQALRLRIRRSLLIDSMLESQVTGKATVTVAQARAYYNSNKKQYYHRETFRIQSISIIPPNAAPDTLKEAKKRAEDAYGQAKVAKTYREFGLLAEKMSDDDFHVNYGDHRDRPAKDFPPQVIKAARLMQPGQISGLIPLGNAYTIFRLVSHTPAGTTPFAEVKTKMIAELQKQKTEEVRAALGKTLRQNAKIEIL